MIISNTEEYDDKTNRSLINDNEMYSEIKKHKCVCWYPSAGSDLRPLLYLSEPFYKKHEELANEATTFPDLFILTDYYMKDYMDYSFTVFPYICSFDKLHNRTLNNGDIIFQDNRTTLTVNNIKEIVVNNVAAKMDLISQRISPVYGQGYYMTIKIDSHGTPTKKLGTWETDVIYLYSENTAFAKEILIRNKIDIDYIVRVRYGGAFGGSRKTFGSWLFQLAEQLNVKYYVSSINDLIYKNGDVIALKYLQQNTDFVPVKPSLIKLYEREWYKREPVAWYRVKKY